MFLNNKLTQLPTGSEHVLIYTCLTQYNAQHNLLETVDCAIKCSNSSNFCNLMKTSKDTNQSIFALFADDVFLIMLTKAALINICVNKSKVVIKFSLEYTRK